MGRRDGVGQSHAGPIVRAGPKPRKVTDRIRPAGSSSWGIRALPRWADVLADYEIVQPFPQLGREVYRLTDDEWAATTLLRVTDASVATGKVLGLTRRGWRPGVRQSGGDLMWLDRPLGDGTILVVELGPGIPVAGLPAEPEQRLQRIGLDAGARSGWDSVDALPLERLDPVTASELIRDLTDLTA